MTSRIIYSVIMRFGSMTLAEYALAEGTYRQFIKTVASKVSGANTKKSYLYDQYEFHICVEDNFLFMAMTEKGFKMRIVFAYLDDIKKQFFEQFPPQVRETAIAYSLNDQFSKTMKQRIEYYNSPEADKLALIKGNIDQTKSIMMENLDKLLERGEKIDILVQKTNQMVRYCISTDMKKNATALKRDMWWKNKKMTLIIIFAVLLGIYILLGFICGFAFKKC